MSQDGAKRLHAQSLGNKELLASHDNCGCFYCCHVFPTSEVIGFTDEPDGSETGLCPECGVDSLVVGDEESPLSEKLLYAMHKVWF